LACVLPLLACVLTVVAGLPTAHPDLHMLGESQPPKTPSGIVAAAVHTVHTQGQAEAMGALQVHRVAKAVSHVWMHADLNKEFDKESNDPSKHWTCRYCHGQCKTIQCRHYCSGEYCGASLVLGRHKMNMMSLGKGRVSPQYANAVRRANGALAASQTATTDAEFRRARRAVRTALDRQNTDMTHYQNQLSYADAMNQMAYPTEGQKQAQDDAINTIETMNTQNEVDRANEGTHDANSETNKNDGYDASVASGEEADSAMGMNGGLMSEVQNDIDAETSTLNGPDMDKTTGNTAEMTDVSNVAAAVEKLGVKVASAATSAESSASDSDSAEYDADARDTIEDAERVLGDSGPMKH